MDELVKITAADMRRKIVALEDRMRQEQPIVIEPTHYLAPGLYGREIRIPKGTLATGKIHLSGHLNIISQGDISVMTEEGVQRIVAPATLISQAGTKKLVYAHEDTVWTTIHACTETEIEKIEHELVVDTFAEYDQRSRQLETQLETKGEEEKCHLLP